MKASLKARSIRALALSVLIVLGSQAAAVAEKYTERFEKTYQVEPDSMVSLRNTNGRVIISTWDRGSVELVAEKSVNSRSRQAAEETLEEIEIRVTESAGRLEIETDLPRSGTGFLDWLSGRSQSASVSYELRVPRQANLVIRTVNGRLETDGAQGSQHLRSTNGRIDVTNASRRVDARTTNGSIRVGLQGPAEPEIDLGTTNGSITLQLSDDVRAHLEARTVNGSVKTDIPVEVLGKSSRKRMEGDLNGGGAGQIVMRTTNGSIRIEGT